MKVVVHNFFELERPDLLSEHQNAALVSTMANANVSQTGNVKMEKSLSIL
jgi:hypothetical protein